jgi:hypothetical protein
MTDKGFWFLVSGFWLATASAMSADVNLVKNGAFEDGEQHPAAWDRCDDLTTFWEKDSVRGGKCIRIYTRIDDEEFHRREAEMKLDHPPPPKKPRVITGAGYETVGGIDGVHYCSDYIPVKPGLRYTLSVDVRSEGGTPKVFIPGYTEQAVELDEHGISVTEMLRRRTYKGDVDCKGGKDWTTTTFTFCPTGQRDDVKWVRIMLYAYWPLGNYWFDNVKLVEAGADPDAPKRWAARKDKAQQQGADAKTEKVKEAKALLAYIRQGVERYQADFGAPPPSLQALLKDTGDAKWAGPYLLELADDPWGHAWFYAPRDKTYVLKSTGPDGKEGGGDDVE